MKTEDLVEHLALEARPVRPALAAGWLAGGLALGAAASFVLLVAWLGLRPLDAAMAAPSFWLKAIYSVALAACGGLIVRRLAAPTGRVGRSPYLLIAAVAVLAAISGGEIARAGGGSPEMLFGHTWKWCAFRIVTLSVPMTLALMAVLRTLAPTRLTATGAAAGLLAGGVAAVIYGFYCQETSALFLAVWYSLGVGASAAVGAMVGPRLLRW